MAEKKQVMLAMNQMLLINLDEFNQISPAIQSGFLKNVIQLATVKMKRPYGKHVEDFPRMASFIATTNMTDILSDPTGNRRFIGVELTEPIDVSTPPCHEQLYAQILHLLESGERYWFNNEETQDIMEFNKNYQLKSGMEMLFENFFELTTDEKKGKYMNTTTIYEYLKRHGGNVMSDRSLIHFGRTLSNINGIVRRRGKRGSEYLVIMK
jgi:predicted P-loop ATPase